jgi:hypothetical protein
MLWGVWLILGLGFGWWAQVIFGAEPAVPPERDEEPPWTSQAVSLAGRLVDRLTGAGGGGGAAQQQQAANAQPAAPAQLGWPSVLAFFVFILLALLVASEPYDEKLPGSLRWLVIFLLKPRLLSFVSGGLLGWWASRYRHPLAARLNDFYSAFLGSETKSSWALQSVVAIIALLLVVLAVKPDLLDKLESFKAGEVEARFASISTTTREARALTNELSKEITIQSWVNFKKNYREGPREDALEFDHSAIKELRKEIRDILFEGYVEPLADFLACIHEQDRRLDRIRTDDEFVRLTVLLRNKIERESKDGSGASFKRQDWIMLFELTDAQIQKLKRIIDTEFPPNFSEENCEYLKNIKSDPTDRANALQSHAEDLEKKVDAAVAQLKATPEERQFKLSFLDPYFVAAVSDLVGLTLGQHEKAKFLVEVKGGYPERLDYIQPGLVNLYYYLSDAKLKSEAPWELDEELQELDFALAGTDQIISLSQRRMADAFRKRKSYRKIVQTYYRNKVILVTLYLDIFFQRALSGEVLSDANRTRWAQFYRQIEDTLNLQEFGPVLEIGGRSDSNLSDWRQVEIRPDDRFDARVALALSAVLLTEKANRAPQESCAIARFNVQKARELLPELDLNEAAKSQLGGYLSQITARLGASCPDQR